MDEKLDRDESVTPGPGPLLTTKLYIPPLRPNRVPRPRLIDRLNQGLPLGHRLTLISAPAGFGKTTLLSEWVHHLKDEGGMIKGESPASIHPSSFILHPSKVAWLSLDEGDNDPVRFWTYFITALQTVQTGIGQSALAALKSPQPPSTAPASRSAVEWIESVLTALINELAVHRQRRPYILVLDDHHLIKTQLIHQTLTFLLDHLPPPPVGLHLVIAGRADPPLPLPRLRARDQLTELRAPDLRFTPDETAAFLNQVMNLGLSANDVAALEARTEGWIAGLQLAALSMQDRTDVSGFIAAFTGSNRYILDYLVEEVLRQQPEDVQRFLLQTSILDRMTGPLSDALTGRTGGQVMLERLEQANLFIVPLAQDRTWYRYHHLFAQFLRSRLRQAPTPSPAVSDLHGRASEWYEAHGLLAEAVKHALAGQNFERAAHLIEQTARQTVMGGEASTLLGWLEALPGEIIRSRPSLCLAQGWALVIAGQSDTAEPYVQAALQAASTTDAQIRGEAAAIRSLVAVLKSAPQAIELAHQALEHLPADDLFLRSLVALNLGLAHDMRGDITAAGQAYSEASASGQAAGNILVHLMAIVQLADLKVLQGKLHEAATIYRQAIQLATEPGKRLPIVATAHLSMGRLLYEWNDLDGATHHLTTCIELGQQWESTDISATGFVYLAHVRQAQADTAGAQALIRQAEQALQGDILSLPTISVARAYQVRLWLRQGNTEAATRLCSSAIWAEEYQARQSGVSGYLAQIEGATRVRVLMAQGKPELAIGLLDSLLQAAEAAGQTGYVIELLVLQALVLEAQGQSPQAITTLHRALTLAAPADYVRTFVDEGASMAILLNRMKNEGGRMKEYVGKLLAAFTPAVRRPVQQSYPVQQPLIEFLSKRELEVLRLIAAGLSNREIAQELVITVGTVKRHVHHIYGKLEVHSRTQALAKARELGLLAKDAWPL